MARFAFTVLLSLSLIALAFADCDPANVNYKACLAFQWSYPLWHSANIRYLQASGSLSSLVFGVNKISYRKSSALASDVVLCDGTLCGGAVTSLNPAPIPSPNVDTVYAGIQADIRQPWKLVVPNPASYDNSVGRWWSVHFLDTFTNTLVYIDSTSWPTGGSFCVTNGTTCGSGINASFTVPQQGHIVFRAYSSGVSTSCGAEGCAFIKAITFTAVGSVVTTGNPKSDYDPYMGSSYCPYVYNQAPCGNNATAAKQNKYWDGVCQILKLNQGALSAAEKSYIDTTFGSLGIASTGVCTPNYTALNVALSSTDISSGYYDLKKYAQTTSTSVGPWVFIVYGGTWGSDYYGRGKASLRLHALNANPVAVYWTAFTTTAGVTLEGVTGTANNSYSIVFTAPVPVDAAKYGFWSLTVYDASWFLLAKATNVRPAVRGTSNTVVPTQINLSRQCSTSNLNCLALPTGQFNVMLRGYAPQATFQPSGSWAFPTITKCTTGTTCI